MCAYCNLLKFSKENVMYAILKFITKSESAVYFQINSRVDVYVQSQALW